MDVVLTLSNQGTIAQIIKGIMWYFSLLSLLEWRNSFCWRMSTSFHDVCDQKLITGAHEPYTGTQQRYKTNVPWRQNPRLQIYVYFWWKHGTTKRSDTTVSCCGKFISSSSKTHVLRQKPFYKTHGLHRRSTRTHQPRYTVVVYGLQHRSSVHTHYKVHGIRFTIWTEIKTGRVNQEQTQHSTK